MEQWGRLYHHTLKGKLNSINGVSPKNSNRGAYLYAAWDYITNQISNEFYNFIGV